MPERDDDYVALGRALAALRRKAGLTQADAGAQAKVGGNHISAVEMGDRALSYKTLLRLLKVYGTNLRGLADEIERGGG